MKRSVYILLFVVLGVIVSFLAHAAIEISIIKYLFADFETYSLGLTWETWFMIHHIFAVVLFLAGVGMGLQQGIYWWGVLYEGKQAVHKSHPKKRQATRVE